MFWTVPATIFLVTTAKRSSQVTSSTAVAAGGVTVPKDFERRKEAESADEKAVKRTRKLQQLALLLFVMVPHALAWCYQSNPTVPEQLSEWWALTWAQLTDGKLTPAFQLAVSALFIERMCYTWVHSDSDSFISFTKTRLGQAMGKKPLDVVLTIFYINKVIQLGTFFAYYFYVINFASPFSAGFSFGKVTPFQWIWLVHGLVLGQGLNAAIYKAIGKAGVYYGYRLGEPVPWVTGFPFSVVPHPQYFGVAFSCIGINIFSATSAHVAAGWFSLTAVQVLYYVYMAMVEDYL